MKFSKEEKEEYARLENSARDFYVRFKQENGHIGSNYLKLTQKLTPLRVACAGGQVPLEDTRVAGKKEEEDDGSGEPGETGEDDESGEEKPKKKRKKVQVFSDFAFVSKLQTLIKELKDVRTKDKTGELVSNYFLYYFVVVPSLLCRPKPYNWVFSHRHELFDNCSQVPSLLSVRVNSEVASDRATQPRIPVSYAFRRYGKFVT